MKKLNIKKSLTNGITLIGYCILVIVPNARVHLVVDAEGGANRLYMCIACCIRH